MGASARHGTAKKQHRAAPLCRSYPVTLRRHVDDRARLELDATAQFDLKVSVGDRMCCTVMWGSDSLETAVTVYAVHPRGAYALIDVRGFDMIGGWRPEIIRLRRYA